MYRFETVIYRMREILFVLRLFAILLPCVLAAKFKGRMGILIVVWCFNRILLIFVFRGVLE